jgi:hypothetical protein
MTALPPPLGYPVYPGHPITVAYQIVTTFKTWDEAMGRDSGSPYCRALADSRISGAGGCVSAAIGILHMLRRGRNWEDVVVQADYGWASIDNQDVRHRKRWKKGQEQADLTKPLLKKRYLWWVDAVQALASLGHESPESPESSD